MFDRLHEWTGLKRLKYKKGDGAIFIDGELLVKYPAGCSIIKSMNIKNNWLNQKMVEDLLIKTSFGESRDAAKQKAIAIHRSRCLANKEPFRLTDVRVEGIYSYSTFKNYLRCGSRFNDWLQKEKGLNNVRSTKSAIKKYGVEYLRDMQNRGLSLYSVAQMKSYMGKVLGKEIDYKLNPQHEREIVKGRQFSQRFSLFKENLNKELVTIARATGGRRGDLERLKLKDFVLEKGRVVGVSFIGSKGGRDRYSPVLPSMIDEVTKVYEQRSLSAKSEEARFFKTINDKANIHAYRREYAHQLYSEALKLPLFKEKMLRVYEDKGYTLRSKDRPYRTKDGRIYDRVCLFITSQGLGHNRLSVVTTNYFK